MAVVRYEDPVGVKTNLSTFFCQSLSMSTRTSVQPSDDEPGVERASRLNKQIKKEIDPSLLQVKLSEPAQWQ